MRTEQPKHQVLVCVDCGEEFVFPVSAQEYFAEQGYNQSPKRCKSCHSKLKRGRRVAQ
ncbi:MAG TPA: zinc-ribbon domain containing protein [Acidobacteriota bacterium]|nr:zinc-ribbon domain containing protein [Acidobacteriota bacterium]